MKIVIDFSGVPQSVINDFVFNTNGAVGGWKFLDPPTKEDI